METINVEIGAMIRKNLDREDETIDRMGNRILSSSCKFSYFRFVSV